MNRIYHLHQSICIKTFQDQVTGEVSVYQDIMNQPITSVFGLYGLVGLCLSKERTTIVLLKSDVRQRGLSTTTIPFWTNEKQQFCPRKLTKKCWRLQFWLCSSLYYYTQYLLLLLLLSLLWICSWIFSV